MFPLVFILPLPCPLTSDEGHTLCLAADREKRTRYEKQTDFVPAQLSLSAQVLLRYAAAQTLHMPMRNVRICYTERGKPMLYGTKLYCSISHTAGLCVCALSDEPIGIDVERIRPYAPRVAGRVFSRAEQNELQNSSVPDRTFFEIWTRHESYVKCLGTGLADISAPMDTHARFQTFLHAQEFVITTCTFTKSS